MGICSRSGLWACALSLACAVSAGAAEICVKCSDPDANYDCVVNATPGGMAETAAKLYCITALAKSGPHASCAIDRNSAAPCQGVRKELPIPTTFGGDADEPQQEQESSAPEGTAPAAHPNAAAGFPVPQPPAEGAAGAAQPPAQETAASQEAPPKTVQEMVEKGAKSAGDSLGETGKSAGEAAKTASTALEKAGSAVGNAAKSSWKCLSSFFSNC